jgi:formate C-acetyltransferase
MTTFTFKGDLWKKEINVRDFIQENYTPYVGDESFLSAPTTRTKKLWDKACGLIKEELDKGILDLDVSVPSSITSHNPGFLDKNNELIVGFQTDAPLKRSIKPYGGIKLVEQASKAYGYEVPTDVAEIFHKYRKTHNDGVFAGYTKEQRLLRSKKIITGLPDNYGRGRIIGDYRRLALYGIDHLVKERQEIFSNLPTTMSEKIMRLREEITAQITALKETKTMASSYGYDISKPATNFREAVQWIYFAYLAATKQQDGAAMSMGRIDAFLDVYAEKDLHSGKHTEEQLQEIIDDFVIKLRMIRHLRPPEYNHLFAGDPTWITFAIGGTELDGRTLVTKTAFRILHTLSNLGPAPEPNLTVLWSNNLPEAWKKFCAKQSILSSSIQYENDDLMKYYYGDDYGIACCVSGMKIGKEMQFFGARANIVKILLLAINGGKEEPVKHEGDEDNTDGGDIIVPGLENLNNSEYLDFNTVWPQFVRLLDWVAQRYVNTMNLIHYMHDKYNYESLQMALHDPEVHRYMAFGAAGLSVVVDALSAIKYAKVKAIWNSKGVAETYEITGEFPKFGNDDDRADTIATDVVREFLHALQRYETYRNAQHTLSVLTITSNIIYGSATGATPDGRESGQSFAPGANPMHGRDIKGVIASMNSVAKIPYDYCLDGISNTISIIPGSLGKTLTDQVQNLVQIFDGYFIGKKGHHVNVNVLNPEMLKDAQKHPEKYPQLTIRVSGYAVLFNRLSKKQQNEIISRTFHSCL